MHGLHQVDEDQLAPDEAKKRKIMKLLLKIKKGTPPQRKTALRQITEKAREFGAEALFDQILPILMSPTLEDQERHLFVKVRACVRGAWTTRHVHERLDAVEWEFDKAAGPNDDRVSWHACNRWWTACCTSWTT
jgi:hypothetical protein